MRFALISEMCPYNFRNFHFRYVSMDTLMLHRCNLGNTFIAFLVFFSILYQCLLYILETFLKTIPKSVLSIFLNLGLSRESVQHGESVRLWNLFILFMHACLPGIAPLILINCYQWGSCLSCETTTKDPMELATIIIERNLSMELAVISNHRRPTCDWTQDLLIQRLTLFLTARPRTHKIYLERKLSSGTSRRYWALLLNIQKNNKWLVQINLFKVEKT